MSHQGKHVALLAGTQLPPQQALLLTCPSSGLGPRAQDTRQWGTWPFESVSNSVRSKISQNLSEP